MSEPEVSAAKEHRVLTKEKITQIVREVEKTEDVEVTKLSVEPGPAKGENFSGEVMATNFTAKIGGTSKDYHWMVKLPPSDPSRAAMVKAMKMEVKEFRVYRELIPAFEKLVRDAQADIELHFAPTPYLELDEETAHDASKTSILAMENLNYQGYRDATDKKKGLGVEYSMLAMEEMAKFHALGHAYVHSFKGGVEEALKAQEVLATDYFCAKPDPEFKKILDSFIGENLKQMIMLIECFQEPGQNLVDQFKSFHEKNGIFALRDQLYTPSESGFNTLCHGDTWFNNMLFQHETVDGVEKPSKCLLLDLAVTRWASPATDLAYFLFLSTPPNLRLTHQEEFLGHYHDTFVSTMHKLGFDPSIYSYRQLLKDYDERCYVGFVMGMWVLPMMLANKEDAIAPEELFADMNDPEELKASVAKNHELQKKAFKNNLHIKMVMSGNYHEMIRRGFFEKFA